MQRFLPLLTTVLIAVPQISRAQIKPEVTATIGAFLTPVAATASSSQAAAGRTPSKLIDGSGWGESAPGSGVYTHTSNVGAGGNSMWNGDPNSWLQFDLGAVKNVSGVYIWNYNEGNGWSNRSVKDLKVLSSGDNQNFAPVGDFTLQQAPGADDYRGQTIKFATSIRARYFRFEIQSNYKGGENSGLSEVRFADADTKYFRQPIVPWKPTYARPRHAKLKQGQARIKTENIVYPPDAGIIDVSKAPYFAKGDGVTDDTAAIQRALNDYPNSGAIIYLPNGIYRISDTLRYSTDKDGGAAKLTTLQGQSQDGTVIQLRDHCPGFQAPRAPKALVWTGSAPAQRFGNEIRNLTFDSGVGNPGACGVQFIANNQGGMWDVSIVSGDGQGVTGLDMGYTDEQGPCLIKNVSVLGFDVGVRVANSVASETMEGITVQGQNKFGFRNDGQPCTVRGLRSRNAVPAFYAAGGFTTLVGADLQGVGATKNTAAVICEANMMARNIHTRGYKTAIQSTLGSGNAVGPNILQWLSKPAVALFGAPTTGLRLPIQETPIPAPDAIENWISPTKFGAKTDDGADDSRAIQAAIDSGKSTVYLPRGAYDIDATIVIRGKVGRIIGCKAWLQAGQKLIESGTPMFRFEEGAAPIVEMDGINTDFSSGKHFFIENNAARTLVLRRMQINFQGADAYHGDSKGTVFLEDVVGRWFKFKNQTVWARQFNPEGDGTHISNDGGQLWVLGLKTEGYGTLVETKNGGVSEVSGGLSYTVGDERDEPMFTVDATSRVAISFCEVNYSNTPYLRLVRQTSGAQIKELKHDDARWGGYFSLFTAGK